MHTGQANVWVMQLEITEKRKLASRRCIQFKFYKHAEMYVYISMKIWLAK